MDILYTFEKKMHLSRTRKIDKLLHYFALQTGCQLVTDISTLGKEHNGNYISTTNGVNLNAHNSMIRKVYKVWSQNKKTYMQILAQKIDRDNYTLIVNNYDNETKQVIDKRQVNINIQNRIYECYAQFVNCLAE